MQRVTARVEWFKHTYGFSEEVDGKSYFLHWSEIKSEGNGFRTLNSHDVVEFTPVYEEKGWSASEISIISRAADERQ